MKNKKYKMEDLSEGELRESIRSINFWLKPLGVNLNRTISKPKWATITMHVALWLSVIAVIVWNFSNRVLHRTNFAVFLALICE